VIKEPYSTIIEKLLRLLKERFGDDLISVAVYGSVARGDYRNDSDIDLLIIARNLPFSITERIKIFDSIETLLEEDIMEQYSKGYYMSFSPIMKTPEEAKRFSPIYMDMTEDAIVIYDKDNFFSNILAKFKNKLNELGFERVWLGKKWYWRKRDYKFGKVFTFDE
jgi:predicted nucleotidyltransferase